jgi:hypothetical protein
MTMTTIKVSMTTRDRLKAHAEAAHQSLGAYLDGLADLADRRARMEAMRLAMTTATDSELASYRAETGEWDSVDAAH